MEEKRNGGKKEEMNNRKRMQSFSLLAVVLVIFAMMAPMPVFAQQSASASRDIQTQTLAPGQSTNVTVTITNNVAQALILGEDIPAGWNLTRVSDDADMYNPSTNEWVWLSVGAGETKMVIYNLTVPSDATAGDYSITGKILNATGVIDTVKGEGIIIVVPDATPPTIEFIDPTPENGSTVTVNYVNVTASVTDPSGVASVLLNWNGENETMDMIGPSNFSRNKTNLPNGIYTYKVYANDIYDNWGVSEKRTVTVKVPGVTLYVNETGWWREDGAFNACTTPIQSAIDNATAGDTVFVYNGTYYGMVDIPKSVTLHGEDANITTIHGEWLVDKVVYVTANNVTASGFTVTGTVESGAYGIYVSSADYCNISDNIVSDGDYGIYLTNSDCSFVARNNASARRDYGIYLSSCDNCSIDGNIANSNGDYGIYLDSSFSSNITNNTASNNNRGISLSYSSNCKLENNTAYWNGDNNIYLSYSNNCTLINNIANNSWSWPGIGIHLYYSDNCSLENNTANSNYNGIYLYLSSNNNITNNTANLNNQDGIYLYHSSTNNITGNTASNNNYGIYLYSTSIDNVIAGNTISYNNEGFHLYYSGRNLLYHNNLLTNTVQAYDHNGFNDWDNGAIIGGNYWSDHICTGNPSNGSQPYTKIDTNAGAVDYYPFENYCVPPPWRTIYVPDNYTSIQAAVDAANPGDTVIVRDGTYIENVEIGKSVVIRSENGSATTTVQALNFNDHVFEVTKYHVTINGFTVTGATGSGKAGIYLGSNAVHCNISGNNASSNYCGIRLSDSPRNSITNNTANSNNNYGIHLSYSSNNDIINNTAKSNIWDGIHLHYSNNNNIINNIANSNRDHGVHLYYSRNNNISSNTINLNRYYGIYLSYSSNNDIINNTANSNNNYGIRLEYSSNNNKIHNNYLNNTNNAYDDGTNTWNITKQAGTNIIGGPYFGGNYWSDYTGIDADGDGLGDTPYNITGGTNKDYLPLVRIPPDLVINYIWVNWPDNCTICYKVTNMGNGTAPAWHNTSLYVDGVERAYDYIPVDLAPNESYTGCFDDYNWTYTPPGDNITVCADSNNTIAESNETNNCMTNLWMCGDVAPYPDCNEKVDMGDVILLLNNVSYPGNPRYLLCNEWAGDCRCSGKIDMGDVILLLNNVSYPGNPRYVLECCC